MNQELRLYTFVNFYLSSIQQGIQSAHLVHELFLKYPTEEAGFGTGEMLWDWAKNHKTMIVLNGGMNSDIHEIFYTMEQLDHTRAGVMPFACFHEDEKSLGSVMTSVAVVVPQQFYDAKQDPVTLSYVVPSDNPLEQPKYVYKQGTPEWTFVNMLKGCGLAK